MRHSSIIRLASRTALIATVFVLSLLPGMLEAQTFTPVPPPTVNNVPYPPGNGTGAGASATSYFKGHTATLNLLAGSGYDYVILVNPIGFSLSGYSISLGADMRQCILYGDAGFIQIRTPDLLGPTIQTTTWGTGCTWHQGYILQTAFHFAGQPNGPVFDPPPPVKFKNPGDGFSCTADPCDTRTGLYYQQDTDITVPDVLPITLTRT